VRESPCAVARPRQDRTKAPLPIVYRWGLTGGIVLSTLPSTNDGRPDDDQPTRSPPPRHPRPPGPAHPGPRADARLRDRTARQGAVRRGARSGRELALSGAAAAPARELRGRRVGNLREQPPRALLHADAGRAQAARGQAPGVRARGDGDPCRAEPRLREEADHAPDPTTGLLAAPPGAARRSRRRGGLPPGDDRGGSHPARNVGRPGAARGPP